MKIIPELSIIMPAYNAEKYINEAIHSILMQSYANFELIIINDGSKDRTEEFIKNNNDNRIKYFKQQNKGVSVARNLAIQHSKGKWLAFLDADDVWLPDTLATFADNFLDADFIFGEYSYLGGPKDGKIAKDLTKLSDDKEDLLYELISHNFIGIGGVCFRANLTKKYFDETLGFAEDYKLWLTLFMKDIRIKKIDRVLYKYRMHPESALHKNNQQEYLLAKLLLSFAGKNKYAEKRASEYYNDYVNATISKSIGSNDFDSGLADYRSFSLQAKTKLKLLLYMRHPKILKKVSKSTSQAKQWL